jgi:hypothetical protein
LKTAVGNGCLETAVVGCIATLQNWMEDPVVDLEKVVANQEQWTPTQRN